ncbi:MAG: hypothetical protein ACTHLW_21145 [Verrucomicrobiota bacterium]
MRSNLDFIESRISENLEESGTDIVLKWQKFSGATTTDINGSKLGTSEEVTETLKGFVHFVQIATSQVRQFNEVQVGDCIVDFAGDVALDGKDSMRFFIAGEQWEVKQLSAKLGQTWDAVVQGRRLMRSVLLRKSV